MTARCKLLLEVGVAIGVFAELAQELKYAISAVAKHWKGIAGAATLISAVLCYLMLMIYAKAVGRLDLLNDSISLKAALLPWMGGTLSVFVVYMVLLFSNAMVYGLMISLFRRFPKRARKVSVILLLPAVTGVLGFTIFAFRFPDVRHVVVVAALVAVIVFELAALYRFNRTFRGAVDRVVRRNTRSRASRGPARLFLFVLLCYSLFFVTVLAISPLILLLHAYVGEDTPEALNVMAGMSVVTLPALLAPVVVFYVSTKRIALRLLQSSVLTIILSIFVIGAFPGVTSTMVYSGALLAGARDVKVSSYKLLDEDPQDFETVEWGDVVVENGKPVVSAFPLFSVGDSLLLCPASLVKTTLFVWPSKSDLCLFTKKQTVKRLVRKTPKRIEHRYTFGGAHQTA